MRLVLLLAAAIIALAPLGATAQTRIVAVVNGDPITSYDVSQREKLLRLTGVRGNLKSQALEELIDETVQMGAAERARMVAGEAEVDAAVANLARQVKLSPAQLSQALSQSGVSMETLKARLKAQLSFGKLVQAQFQRSSPVTEQDLVAALVGNEELENTIDAARYDLRQVIIALPEEPSRQRMARAEQNAASLRQRFTSCSGGIETAKSTRNVVVMPYGWRIESDLPTEVRNALADVPVGRLSPPITTPRGLVMFAVCDKQTVRSTNAAMKNLEDEMRQEKGNEFSKQFARQLRRDAMIERR